jgi:hypothetical protein
MTTRLQTLLRVCALAAALAAIGSTSCWAQLGGPGLSGNGVGPVVNPADAQNRAKQQETKRELPPAVPGAKSDPSLVAPATKLPSEMNPTDALFDAINRGDITVARDAINRGADLEGRNVLGMTPMELSIDLSRNDIAFLLLSMRGADSGPRQPPSTKDAKGAKQQPIREVRAKAPPLPRVTAPPPPRVAHLFSGDGGTPVPQSGFLGFSGTATASSGN